jgi:N-acetylneuraminic acid mutarotase
MLLSILKITLISTIFLTSCTDYSQGETLEEINTTTVTNDELNITEDNTTTATNDELNTTENNTTTVINDELNITENNTTTVINDELNTTENNTTTVINDELNITENNITENNITTVINYDGNLTGTIQIFDDFGSLDNISLKLDEYNITIENNGSFKIEVPAGNYELTLTGFNDENISIIPQTLDIEIEQNKTVYIDNNLSLKLQISVINSGFMLPDGFGHMQNFIAEIEQLDGDSIISKEISDINFSISTVETCEECKLKIYGFNYKNTPIKVLESNTTFSLNYETVNLFLSEAIVDFNRTNGDNQKPDILDFVTKIDNNNLELFYSVADPEGDRISCEIDFGDDSEVIKEENCFEANLTHSYSELKNYDLIFKISDKNHFFQEIKAINLDTNNDSNSDLNITNLQLEILDESIDFNQYSVTFRTVNQNNSDINCSINFNNEYQQELNFCGLQTINYSFESTGEKAINITVNDSKNIKSLNYGIKINELLKNKITAKNIKIEAISNRTAQITGLINTDQDFIKNISIDWGINGISVKNYEYTEADFTYSYTYPSEGDFNVTVGIEDENGSISEKSETVKISANQAPFISVNNIRTSQDRVTFDYLINDIESDSFTTDINLSDGTTYYLNLEGNQTFTHKISEDYSQELLNITISSTDSNSKNRIKNISTNLNTLPNIFEINSTLFREKVTLNALIFDPDSKYMNLTIDWGDSQEEYFEINKDFRLKNYWITKSNMLNAKTNLTSSVIGNKIYTFGGFNTSYGNLNTVEIYNIETNSWSIGENMPTPRRGLTSAVANNKIYVIGGYNDNGHLSTVEIYDTETNSWTIGENMPTPRRDLTSAVIDNKIYVIGGYNDNGHLSTVEIYDTEINSWSIGENMPTPRNDFTSSVVDNKIYVIGGQNENNQASDKVEIYNTETNSWSIGENMPTSRAGITSSVSDNKIAVFGGFYMSGTDKVELKRVEIYSPDTDSWSIGQDMQNKKIDSTSVSKDELIYILGGHNSDFQYFNEVQTYDLISDLAEQNNQFLNFDEVSQKLKIENFEHNYSNDGQKTVTLSLFDFENGQNNYSFNIDINRTVEANFNDLIISKELINNQIKMTLFGELTVYNSKIEKIIFEFENEDLTINNNFNEINISQNYANNKIDTSFIIKIYDYLGNVFKKEYYLIFETIKPTISNVIIPNISNSNIIDINFTTSDIESGVNSYAISDINHTSLSNLDWQEVNQSEANISTNYELLNRDLNQTIYIWIKDNAENITQVAYSLIYDFYPPQAQGFWETSSNMPIKRSSLKSVFSNEKIYIIGGENSDGLLQKIDILNTETNFWTESNLTLTLDNTSNIALDSKIYFIGGQDSYQNARNDLNIYDTNKDTWSYGLNLPIEQTNAQVTTIENKIYLLGTDNSLQIYDLATESWDYGTNSSLEIECPTAQAISNKIYFFENSNLEVYNTQTDTWELITSKDSNFSCFSSAVINNKIYLFGGMSNQGNYINYSDEVHIFDPEFNIWITGSDMPTPRAKLTSVASKNHIYAIGGYSSLTNGFTDKVEIFNPDLFDLDTDNNQFKLKAIDNFKLNSYYFGKKENPTLEDFELIQNPSTSIDLLVDFNFSNDFNTTYFGFIKDESNNTNSETHQIIKYEIFNLENKTLFKEHQTMVFFPENGELNISINSNDLLDLEFNLLDQNKIILDSNLTKNIILNSGNYFLQVLNKGSNESVDYNLTTFSNNFEYYPLRELSWITGKTESNSDINKKLEITEARSLNITITGETEYNCDFIYIYDTNGNEIYSNSGTHDTNLTVNGSFIRVNLRTDSNTNTDGVTVKIEGYGSETLLTDW